MSTGPNDDACYELDDSDDEDYDATYSDEFLRQYEGEVINFVVCCLCSP